MGLKTNAVLKLQEYSVDDEGTHLHFVCYDPGPGEASDYFLLLTDQEISTALTQDALINLIQNKMERKYRAAVAAAKLDSLIDYQWTV